MTDEEMLRISRLGQIKQNGKEILWTLKRVREHLPCPAKFFLEIGSWLGGSMAMWSQVVSEDGLLISITMTDHCAMIEKFVRLATGKRFILINQDSGLQNTKEKLIHALGGHLLDGVFFDGEGTAKHTRRDMKLYTLLVGSPGFMAFHDIIPKSKQREDASPTRAGLWQTMKYSYNYEEKREAGGTHTRGIGLILL